MHENKKGLFNLNFDETLKEKIHKGHQNQGIALLYCGKLFQIQNIGNCKRKKLGSIVSKVYNT